MTDKPGRRFRFIGCEIIYREACALTARCPHMVDVEFLRKGLHDLQREDMNAKIQAAIDATDSAAGYEAILLGYARCNDGLAGIAARDIPLVIPRAHDCITFFFGSREEYSRYFEEHPGTYFMTTGWTERNLGEGEGQQPAYGQTGVMGRLGLAESYEEMVSKYGKENADFIRESLGGGLEHYTHMLYLKMGVCDEQAHIEEARDLAAERGWEFGVRNGDMTLLEKLFRGDWDEDFVVVRPGERIVARNDERVLDAESEEQ